MYREKENSCGGWLTRKAYYGVLGSAGWVSCQGLGEPPGVLGHTFGPRFPSSYSWSGSAGGDGRDPSF